MARNFNIKKPKVSEIKKPEINNDLNKIEHMLLSFKHFDIKQGDSFACWQEKLKLSDMLELFHGISGEEIKKIFNNKKYTIYGNFPEETDYEYPKHVPNDANWARIHLDGQHCIIGHVVRNIFYIVFLDGDHKFWPSELKHT